MGPDVGPGYALRLCVPRPLTRIPLNSPSRGAAEQGRIGRWNTRVRGREEQPASGSRRDGGYVMAAEPNEREPFGPGGPVPDFEAALSNLTNPELLSALDLALLELEKRLYRYAHLGPQVLEMADEGLVLAARTGGGRAGAPLPRPP